MPNKNKFFYEQIWLMFNIYIYQSNNDKTLKKYRFFFSYSWTNKILFWKKVLEGEACHYLQH